MAKLSFRSGALPLLLAGIAGWGVLPQPARAACAGSTTLAMTQCAAADYSQADKELNTLYRSLRGLLVSRDNAPPVGAPPVGTRAARLQQAQRQWITLRDLDCRLEAGSVEGGSLAPLIEQACLTRHTRARIGQLDALYQAYRPL